ncbi:MAG: M56 family metallopeptidase, partial [Muribaculaceae bacterium]|nr:M56 family metallopeptidase [Muribaculaceae bacterium]
MIFTFKAGMVLLALLLVYKLLLAGDRQPWFSRMVLLAFYAAAPAAVLLGGQDYGADEAAGEYAGIAEAGPLLLLPGNGADAVTGGNSPSWAIVLITIWIAGMAVVCAMTLICGLRIRKLLSDGTYVMRHGRKIVITDNGDIAPFSVRNTVVMSRKDYEEAADIILLHELRHIARRHWIDLCISRIAIIVYWYNPAAWLMADELRTVHEYEADAAVLSAGVDARLYQILLIK